MTFGIDVSGYQAGMDFVRAKAEGVEFVIVKAAAQNTSPGHTVADGYHDHIDAVVAAALPKGHYQAPHAAVPPEQAASFLARSTHRYTRGDVIGLDNEPLGSYGVFWNDAQCARYFRQLHTELDHPYDRMWLYCPAHLTRQHGQWPECEALGVKFWWVAYGARPTGQTPDHEPSLQGSLSRWDVHQFTDRALVAGRPVDGNYSPHPVTELFGEETMYNPWAGWRVTGTWDAHASYSEGGTDWPLPYGTALRAVASGRLVNNGWVGTAGRRATLYFDKPVKRVKPRSGTRMVGGYVEHDCDMVAFVYQHAKGYLANGWYGQGALVGFSGASASGKDWGGDVHLHGHGLCAHGRRVDFMKFLGAAPSLDTVKPIVEPVTPVVDEEIAMALSAKYVFRNEPGQPREYMLIDEDLPPLAGNTAQRGYRVSLSVADGEAFGILAGDAKGGPVPATGLSRAQYIKVQEWCRKLYDQKHAA